MHVNVVAIEMKAFGSSLTMVANYDYFFFCRHFVFDVATEEKWLDLSY